MSNISLKHAFRRSDSRKYMNVDNKLICTVCEAVVESIIEERKNGFDAEELVTMIIDVCSTLNIEPEAVCEGAIRLNADIILYIIDNRECFESTQICAIILQDLGCKGNIKFWKINLPKGNTIDKEKGLRSEAEPFKILQLSDFHYDPMYLPGGYGNCKEPLCCQSDLGLAEYEDDAAGYWGDYRNCDTPRHVIVNALKHIKEEHTDLEYVYFTGDVISHRVWETSRASNSKHIKDILNEIKDAFPFIPVYPILGNHEPHPLNVYSPSSVTDKSVSTQWVFDEFAGILNDWVPEEAQETIRKGGYYTVLLRPGFRLIALNSNVCYAFNWWLLYEDVDPFGQLQWLADTLYEAEKKKEFVHILSHVPSGDGTCYLPWSREFRRIIERFSNTITAQFNGHSHKDEWLLYHNRHNEPIHVAWNGGSLTTYSKLNYNYKVYDVDDGNYEILDFASWTFNLTEANLNPSLPPVWFKLYSFKEAYGVESLSPKDIKMLLEDMAEDHSLVQLQYRHRYRDADAIEKCNDACMKKMMCRMVTMEYGDSKHCHEILNKW